MQLGGEFRGRRIVLVLLGIADAQGIAEADELLARAAPSGPCAQRLE